MQFPEATEHVRRVVLVTPGADRPVRRFRDLDVPRTREEALDGDASLCTRERCTDTRVDAVSETDVLATVRAIETELVRVLELSRVTVRGAVHQEDDSGGG